MLEEILNFIHNYFEKAIYSGKIVISSNAISMQENILQDGQYFKIEGSVFNDGVHQFPCNYLKDETFDGRIIAMAIPLEVIRLSEEIETWQEKYGESISSPYQSESFGGYSYSKSSGRSGSTGNDEVVSWKSVFGSRLNHWRKIQ